TLDVGNSSGTATAGWLLFGAHPIDVPTHFGGHLLVAFLWIAPITVGPGGSALPATVPDDFALAGLRVDVQVVEHDAGAAHGLSFSDGVELTVGRCRRADRLDRVAASRYDARSLGAGRRRAWPLR